MATATTADYRLGIVTCRVIWGDNNGQNNPGPDSRCLKPLIYICHALFVCWFNKRPISSFIIYQLCRVNEFVFGVIPRRSLPFHTQCRQFFSADECWILSTVHADSFNVKPLFVLSTTTVVGIGAYVSDVPFCLLMLLRPSTATVM